MKANILLLTVFSVPLFGACAMLTSASPSEQFFDSCSGSYTCTGGGESASPTLQKDGDTCDVGGIALSNDGTGTDSSGDSFTWTGTATSFDVCYQGACLTCTPTASATPQSTATEAPADSTPAPTATASPKSCTGTAAACSAFDGDMCAKQSGCYWNVGGKGSCDGTPDPCDKWLSAAACATGLGCTWQ